jgi:hypothetical protein
MFDSRFTSEKCAGEYLQKRQLRHDRRRRSAPTSLTLREELCAAAPLPLARRNLRSSRSPGVTPERPTELESPVEASLEHSTARWHHSSLSMTISAAEQETAGADCVRCLERRRESDDSLRHRDGGAPQLRRGRRGNECDSGFHYGDRCPNGVNRRRARWRSPKVDNVDARKQRRRP